MNNQKITRSIKIKENGKLTINLKKDFSGSIGNMQVDQTTLNIIETKVSYPKDSIERKFIISLVNSNKKGEHKISQLSNCSIEDLEEIRNSINIMLDTAYEDKKAEREIFQFESPEKQFIKIRPKYVSIF